MILVVGATGMVGSEVCRRLAERGTPVRALVRSTSDPARITALHRLGIETVEGDVRSPSTLPRALDGVDAVVCTVSSMPFSYVAGVNDIATTDTRGLLDLAHEATRAGVDRFVYLSCSGSIASACPLRDAKLAVEAALIAGPLDYTILRPSYFMEVWLSPAVGFDAGAARATIYGEGDEPVSWISFGDVAEFIVQAVHAPEAASRTFELGGPDMLSPRAVVRIFERVGGHPFELSFVDVDDLESQRRTARDPMQQSFAALQCSLAKGDPIAMERVLEVFPIQLTSVERYAESVLGRVPVGAG